MQFHRFFKERCSHELLEEWDCHKWPGYRGGVTGFLASLLAATWRLRLWSWARGLRKLQPQRGQKMEVVVVDMG